MANNVVPAGSILSYVGEVAPEGWLLCDGTAVSRAKYSKLFNLIGVKYGYGNQKTSFNLPDFRGRFLRMLSGDATNDPDRATRTAMATGGNTGNAMGSVQAGGIEAHTHLIQQAPGDTGVTPAGTSAGSNSVSYQSGSAGGNETRPLNAYVNYIIKY